MKITVTTDNGQHLFPESRITHLSNCWCEKAINWRKKREEEGK